MATTTSKRQNRSEVMSALFVVKEKRTKWFRLKFVYNEKKRQQNERKSSLTKYKFDLNVHRDHINSKCLKSKKMIVRYFNRDQTFSYMSFLLLLIKSFLQNYLQASKYYLPLNNSIGRNNISLSTINFNLLKLLRRN